MALFNDKKEVKKKAPAVRATAKKSAPADDGRHHTVLRAPWMSEKALIGTEKGVYVFEVPTDANKLQIAAAVESIYKVTPRQVRIVNLPAKRKSLRTRRGFGTRAARHKAYVYLKEGDTIQF
jgi:large subunit ribosomal protein L23